MRLKNLLTPSIIMLFFAFQTSAQILKPKKAMSASKHYANLGKKDKTGTNKALDTIQFPLSEFRRMPYLKLATNYIKDLPASFDYPDPPANSIEQTKAEIQFLLLLDSTRTTEDTILYLQLADVYHDPFTFNPTDPDYDRNFSSLFFVGKPLGSWYNYKKCPKTAKLLSKVIQDATFFVFTFKYIFSKPRPYHSNQN